MSTFSAFRLAARTLLHPGRSSAPLPCQNAIALHHHARFKSKKPVARVNLRNENIPYPEVSLVEDNVLVKTSLASILSSINRKKQWVELVTEDPIPIVRVINKQDALEREKKRKLRQREVARRNIVKEVQLTWWSEKSDLEHKIARVRTYLEMGARVDVVFSSKPNTPPPPMQTRQEKVKNTIELMEGIATEWKPVEWRKNMTAIYLQGKANAAAAAEQEDEAEEDGEEADEVKEEAPPAPRRPVPPHLALAPKPKGYIDISAMGYIPPVRRISRR